MDYNGHQNIVHNNTRQVMNSIERDRNNNGRDQTNNKKVINNIVKVHNNANQIINVVHNNKGLVDGPGTEKVYQIKVYGLVV